MIDKLIAMSKNLIIKAPKYESRYSRMDQVKFVEHSL